MNFLLEKAGLNGTNSYMARSFLNIGKHTDLPALGDIVVLWRVGKDTQWGHVGLYVTEDDIYYFLLGGNQDGTVKIKRYPKWQLLDIRTLHV